MRNGEGGPEFGPAFPPKGPRAGGFFRGSEGSRLAVLAVVMAVGWIMVFSQFHQAPRVERHQPTVSELAPLPPPDDAPEFQGLQDRHVMTQRDNAAYATLLARVREAPPEALARESRRDVLFSQLLENPARYRGLPIHVEGTLRRVLRQDVEGSKIFRDGHYYEGYLFTEDSVRYPWVIAFEEAPPDLEVGDDIQQRVEFDGYFLKLWAYRAADDKARIAPLLIGRFPVARRSVKPVDRGWPEVSWPFAALALITVYFTARVISQMRRGVRERPQSRRTSVLQDQIEPAALADWIERAPDDGEDEARP